MAAPLLALALLGLSGCSSLGNDADTTVSEPAVEVAPEVSDDGFAGGGDSSGMDADSSGRGLASNESAATDGVAADAPAPAAQPALISTGTVSLRSDDVAEARFAVQRVADEAGGQIAEEETDTDDAGAVRRSRLVLRVPAAAFDSTLAALGEVADLARATRSSEDVTTQVIDTRARVRAQAASLERVEALLTQASTLKDVVAIEAQLTRRQADLDSLRSQQAYLADQTSLSTITVHLERTEEAVEEEPARAGFLAGLTSGWSALGSSLTAVATVTGAALPFAGVLLLAGAPLWLVVRRRRDRSREHHAPAADPLANP